jgi:hypothetical protein
MDHLRGLEMLSDADRLVAAAEMAVMDQIAEVDKLRVSGDETAVAVRILRAFTDSLMALKQRRELIVHTIQQMERG